MNVSKTADVLERIHKEWSAVPRELALAKPRQGETVDQRLWRLCVSPTEVTLYEPHTARHVPADTQFELRYSPRLLVICHYTEQQGNMWSLELAPSSPAAFLASLFPMLAATIKRKREYASIYGMSLCHSILAATLEQIHHPTRTAKGKAARRRETFYALERFVTQNLDRAVSVRDAAEALSMSASYLNRVCRDFRTQTFSQYLNLRRLELGRRLLLCDPPTKVADLAQACGFSRAGYFVKSFRELYGMPPMRLRKELRRGRARSNPDLHTICGFEILPPVTSGSWISEPEDLPQVTLVIINTRPTPADVDWLSPAGIMDYQGEIAGDGRWIIGVPGNNVIRVRPAEDEAFIYQTGMMNCQILL
ncbi:MAG: AraC-like DNA-binding protein [Rhodothermales bacterium]|jgi:AraC-like DNA-binding protein